MKRNSKYLVLTAIPLLVLYFIIINLFVSNLFLSIGLLFSMVFVMFIYVSILRKNTEHKTRAILFLIIIEVALNVLFFSLG